MTFDIMIKICDFLLRTVIANLYIFIYKYIICIYVLAVINMNRN